ncbi:uncharacterized protein BDV14DRAFT_196255 [Aspergillus stella-maris]|uniref:uncharacterized protein n=1 Tax=Aspergillus stella-maris TaxID=1810926 RepID=UPI003CCD1441
MSNLSAATAVPVSKCRPFFLRTMCDTCKELQKTCATDDTTHYIPTRSLQYPARTYPMVFDLVTEMQIDIKTVGIALGNQVRVGLETWLRAGIVKGKERRFHVCIREVNEVGVADQETDIWIRHSRDLATESEMVQPRVGNADKPAGHKISILVDFPHDYSPAINILPLLPMQIVDAKAGIDIIFQDGERWLARPALGPDRGKSQTGDKRADILSLYSDRQRYDSCYHRLEYFAELAKANGQFMIWSNLPLFEGGDVGVARRAGVDNFVRGFK